MDKCILVIGASSGIGLETSKELAKKGYSLVLVSRHIDKIKDSFITYSKEVFNDKEHFFYNFDVTKTDCIESFIKSIVATKNIDSLVYCVGNGDVRKLKDLKYDVLLPIMQANFFSFIETIRVLLNCRKSKDKQFNIVTISSLASTHANTRYYTAYSTSKAALEASIRVLASELVLKNVSLCAVKPGYVKTPRLDTLDSEKLLHDNLEEHLKKSGYQPAGFISAKRVAIEICHLLECDDLSFSGAIIPINAAAVS